MVGFKIRGRRVAAVVGACANGVLTGMACADAIESVTGTASIQVGVASDASTASGQSSAIAVGACDGTNADPLYCPSGGETCYALEMSWTSPAVGGCGGDCPPESVSISMVGDDTIPDEWCASYTGSMSVEVVVEIASPLATVSAPWIWSGRGFPSASLERVSGSGCLQTVLPGERWVVGPGRYRYTLSFDVFGPDNGVGPNSNLDVVLEVDAAADCNGNCWPDSEDVQFGVSADVDLDGIPDECEVVEATSFGPPDGDEGTGFGRAVALEVDGESLAIGAPGSVVDDTAAGSVWIYEAVPGDAWRSVQQLRSSTAVPNGAFGIDVVAVGDRVMVGALSEGADPDGGGVASGAVHVFQRNGSGIFTHRQRLTPPGATAGQAFGFGLSASGDWLAVGSYNDDDGGANAGAVFLYQWIGEGGYEFRQKVTASPSAPNQKFGVDTALAGDTLVVGAYRDSSAGVFEAGAAYVFERDGAGLWSQSHRILADPVVEGAWFGDRVGLTGSTLVVAASKEANAESANGAAYLFDRSIDGFVQQARLIAPSSSTGNWFGSGVAISGGRCVVGGRGVASDAGGTGNAFLFAASDGSWFVDETMPPPTPEVGANHGWAVEIADGTVAIGASSGSGRCVVFDRFVDCDGNGVDDDRQLDGGAADCNGNLILDGCEIDAGTSADCNGNGIPDECEIADGTATDIDGDGILDVCENFVVSVPGDFSSLQAALDAIPDDGASWTISVASGTYDGPFATGGRSVAIEGESAATTILQAGFEETALDANNGLGFWGFSSGSIALRDLTLRNAGKGAEIAGYESVVVERCRFESCLEQGLGIAGMQSFESVTVSDCVALLCGTGYSIVNGWDVSLSNCVSEQGEYGFWLSGNGPGYGGTVLSSCSSSNAFLAGLTVSNEYAVATGGEYRDTTVGPGIDSVWGFRISDAVVSGNGTDGIVAGGDFYEHATSVVDCTIANNAVAGVRVTDANDQGRFAGPSISGCDFENNGAGVSIEGDPHVGGSVASCAFTGNGDAIVATLSSPGSRSEGVIQLAASNLVVAGGGTAFQITSDSGVSITSCSVSQASSIGVVSVTGASLTMTSNTFSENAAGLEIQFGGGDPTGCEVSGNVFCGNGEPQVFGDFIDGGNTLLPCCGAGAVDSDGDGVVDCVDNCPSLANPSQTDCDGDGTGDACEVASGSAADCNGNGVPDACDVASGTSSDGNGDGVPDECQQGTVVSVPGDFDSIQAAIDAAADGWTIEVGPGTYAGSIDLGAKAIVLESTGGAATTVLDGGGAVGSVVRVAGTSEGAGGAVVRGFTIVGGVGGTSIPAFGSVLGGGGVVSIDGHLEIDACVVEGNAAGFGGGVYAYGGGISIAASVLRENQSDFDGGAALFYECEVDLQSTTVESNASGNRGGGVHVVRGTATVSDCEFIDNDAVGFGGAIGWFAGDIALTVGNSLLAGNLAGIDGDALWIRDGYSNLELSGVVICGSGSDPYAGTVTETGVVVVEEICLDCDDNGVVDPWELLRGTAADADGDGVIDACACPADFDGNGLVNGADLGILLLGWGLGGQGDLDGDGTVDGADLGLALLAWGPCE